jgi:hypothetical protein
MTTPAATPAASSHRTPADHTHPCARCGAPVALDVGLCERCNPLGLRDSASSQVHGTVFVAVSLAFIGLAVAARLAVSGIGPFSASIVDVRSDGGTLVAAVQVSNDGTSMGSSTCRITDRATHGGTQPAFVTTPRIGPNEIVTFDARLDGFGGEPRPLDIECSSP